ncbi:indoleamine 2,3-dioxygenase family protein (macronuclear) [Tetrahymena thermophila SB210]|uniref:Indoleamine 2,3-dioxygenase family protein n=1 Tax=Tetrahymena thermophila (strain SB210) TaxID=312017 RepID=Q22MG7_TETTS|nr:indoleamine 2,3-dioxygenase family protein [Tetrahymena thermophila SB210]EAR86314.2 indoleamine 2,3-dioxygenase family protein [Tetrahymena thermophila SB210]BAM73297.1 indoleamine 2,3-dioxyganese gamma II [synthetic construct]|eukprot:XP_977053.2 indoleamine 2,3-dioxygenase family protein [Tetrahymena thermophila SB210]
MFLSRYTNSSKMLHCISRMNSSTFKILNDIPTDNTVPQFTVGRKNGFLPWGTPLARLPEPFKIIDQILDEAPYYKRDGTPGLLATGSFGEYVRENLPLLDVSNIKDSALLFALYRDYTFLTSQYLLEPCHLHYLATKSKDYGLGRSRLPANISVPLVSLAKQLDAKPFMEYSCYATFNWEKIDPTSNLDPQNIRLIRHLEGSQHETGFAAVHIAMVQHSGELVSNVQDILDSVEKKDREEFDICLKKMLETTKIINVKMDTMWEYSSPKAFNNFRSYMMGIKSQPMFPKGVVYEGVSKEPTFYRGVSAANDSIIPTIDNLLELTNNLPDNSFTDMLRDFRTYRPVNHNAYLSYVEEKAKSIGVHAFATLDSNSTVLYQALLDQVSEFRERHWRFTKNYILKHSKHPRATGGTPIITWLPNQLATVMQSIVNIQSFIKEDKLSHENKQLYVELTKKANTQLRILNREVEELKKEYHGQDMDFQEVEGQMSKIAQSQSETTYGQAKSAVA